MQAANGSVFQAEGGPFYLQKKEKAVLDHISVSQINLYIRCPEQYRLRYIEGIKTPPNGYLVQGQAYHAALAKYFRHLLPGETLPLLFEEKGIEEAGDTFDSEFQKALQEEEINWQDEDPGKMKDQGIQMARLYLEDTGHLLKPLKVEDRRETTIEGIKLVTIIDLVTPDRIIDHKMRKRAFSDEELAQDLQSIAYAMIEKRPFEFHVAIKTAKPTIRIQQVPERTVADTEFFIDLMKRIRTAITAGVFIPNPTGWQCGPKWCDYWNRCKGKGARGW